MQHQQQVRELFSELAALPVEQQECALNAKGVDPDVANEVRRLLRSDVESTSFLGSSASQRFGALRIGAGKRLAEFEILELIGRGGMGVVYLAQDTILNRRVAIKLMPELAASQHALARFRQGARAAAKLAHPAIVAVHRFDEAHGVPFIVMEYVQGETLAERIQRLRNRASGAAQGGESRPTRRSHPLSPEELRESLSLVQQVADALDHAHRAGVLHRDVKPSNIIITPEGQAKLTDFGIAKVVTDQTLTAAGEVMASIHYMSPEQANAASINIDHRSDVFSLGVVLYESLALRRPFDGESTEQIIHAVLLSDPTPLRAAAPGVSVDLAVVCHSALEKLPEQRIPTMAHMAAELRACLNGEPTLTRPPSMMRRTTRFIRRHRAAMAGVLVVLLLVVAAALTYAVWSNHLASQGILAITTPHNQGRMRVLAFRWSDSADALEPARELGSPPLRAHLPPGLYRLVVLSDDRALAEFDDIITGGGVAEHRVREQPEGDPIGGMVAFDAQRFDWVVRGSLTGQPENRSRSLKPFLIDATEVSNAQYKEFIDATGGQPPPTWLSRGYTNEIGPLPVTGVTHAEALAYAVWRGKRLPTQDEWVAAAQFPGSRRLLWGDEPAPASARPSCDAIRATQDATVEGVEAEYFRRARPVGLDIETSTSAGLVNMFGNVKEMTGTVTFFRPAGAGQSTPAVVVTGGDWTSDPQFMDLSSYTLLPAGIRSTKIGFRCARSVQPIGTPSQETPRGRDHPEE